MKISRTVSASGLLLAGLAAATASGPSPLPRLSGYSPEGSSEERKIEEKFLRIPSPVEARRQHRFFTAQPHPAGSERNNQLARSIAESWTGQGWEEVKLRRYDVLVSYPRELVVEMVSPVKYRARLREDSYDVDPDTKSPEVRQGYLALSASGEVTAPVVYAHSGNPEDYQVLRKHGIDVRGKIVLVRYSNPYSYRGFKAFTAQRLGAAAILIYSDPAEDGFSKGKVFPEGPWGPESHIQRGAITYDFMVAGDPLTPGWASVPGAKHLPMDQAVSLPRIMAVPLSWRDAKPLLENMDGPLAPPGWKGGLNISYRLGGDKVRAHVKVDMDTRLAPNYVVEARINGSECPDEWILVGNHRDAWEFGGVDPSSGTASMMELTRALGELKSRGIRPKRTIIACSWDGEEVGLTGSTEWGEQFAADLKKKLVAYINVDSSVSGREFHPSAVASLANLIVEVSHSVTYASGATLYSVWKEQARRENEAQLVETRIGSGSDHTVFLNFLGRPTIGLTFEGPYGVYHSIYDDFYWMNHFGDPGYHLHVLLAQVWGVLALRLANAEILPFDFVYYAENLRQFLQEVQKKSGLSARLDLKPTFRRISEFRRAAVELKRVTNGTLVRGPLDTPAATRLNERLMEVEGNWLNPDGIPGRPWFKHILYAARFTYAHLELPGITEAVEKGDWKEAAEQVSILEKAVDKNSILLRAAADLLRGVGSKQGAGEAGAAAHGHVPDGGNIFR